MKLPYKYHFLMAPFEFFIGSTWSFRVSGTNGATGSSRRASKFPFMVICTSLIDTYYRNVLEGVSSRSWLGFRKDNMWFQASCSAFGTLPWEKLLGNTGFEQQLLLLRRVLSSSCTLGGYFCEGETVTVAPSFLSSPI